MTENFEYTYSATRQEEVESIRKKYLPEEKRSLKEDKMEILRRLDRNVERPGTIAAIVIGIIGTLIMGVGMCCTMVWAERFFAVGILVGIVGMAVVGAAYPMYKRITKNQREKIADQILALSNELVLQ